MVDASLFEPLTPLRAVNIRLQGEGFDLQSNDGAPKFKINKEGDKYTVTTLAGGNIATFERAQEKHVTVFSLFNAKGALMGKVHRIPDKLFIADDKNNILFTIMPGTDVNDGAPIMKVLDGKNQPAASVRKYEGHPYYGVRVLTYAHMDFSLVQKSLVLIAACCGEIKL